MEHEWNDVRITRLKDLWQVGISAGQIAEDFKEHPDPSIRACFSRSAIIGMAHRQKLQRRREAKVSDRVERAALQTEKTPSRIVEAIVNAVRKPKRADSKFNPPIDRALAVKSRHAQELERPAKPKPIELPTEGLGVGLIDLTRFNCHWPIGDPLEPDFKFCGAKALTDMPYCPHHSRIAYRPAIDRWRDRHT